ncbi:MAG: hypothetical protein ACOYL5_11185 [Phototrophicaceae bacterium]
MPLTPPPATLTVIPPSITPPATLTPLLTATLATRIQPQDLIPTPTATLPPPNMGQGVRSILATDPVVAEFVALARRQLSEALDIPAELFTVWEVNTYRWTDTGLNCPLPDTEYPAAEVDGYRIVLRFDGVNYIFHTSFDTMIACEAGREQLPPPP